MMQQASKQFDCGRVIERRRARIHSSFSIHHSSFSRAAYSFPEVLFAVVVLGIGFIMIAAIFPVAIQQSKATSDETTAASLGQAAVGTLSRLAIDGTATPKLIMPVTGTVADRRGRVHAFDTTDGWEAIRGNMINGDDSRYAFVPLYRRHGKPADATTHDSTAQIYVILTQVRGLFRPAIGGTTILQRTELAYDNGDVGLNTNGTAPPINNPNNLTARRVKIVKMTDNLKGDNLDILEIDPNSKLNEPNQNIPQAVAEGCYLITVGGPDPTDPDGGRIYRVGTRRTDLDGTSPQSQAWELQPGGDMSDPATENIAAAQDAFVVGRERIHKGGTGTTDIFEGPAQDIAIYTTIIPVSP